MQWCFSQVKGAIDDDVAEGKSSDRLTSIEQVSDRPLQLQHHLIKRQLLGFLAFLKKENPSKMFCDDTMTTRIKKCSTFFVF